MQPRIRTFAGRLGPARSLGLIAGLLVVAAGCDRKQVREEVDDLSQEVSTEVKEQLEKGKAEASKLRDKLPSRSEIKQDLEETGSEVKAEVKEALKAAGAKVKEEAGELRDAVRERTSN